MIIDEYRLMAADSYHLQFTEVEIFGFLPSREIIYKGMGCISRDSDSRISIMVMTSLNTTFEQERAEETRKLRKGQVISHQLTCMMDAKDQLGRWWRDCEIFITKITNNGSETTIIAELDKFVLRLPKSTAGYTSRNNTEIIAIHNGHLPFKSIQTAKNSHSANLSFSISGITVEITRDIPCTKITIIHDDAIDLDQIKILLEAISICSGRLITPLLIGRHENEHYHLELLHGCVDNNRLPPALDILPPFQAETLQKFVECYFSSFKVPYGETYAAWHRAYLAADAGIEISSLALCTAIEGIVKYRFTKAILLSAEASNELTTANEKIATIEFPDWIVTSIRAHLERIKESRPTIRKSLQEFAKSNNISSKQIARWESLRNKVAHFDILEDTPEENEKIINDYNICLRIFFKLIARSAGYSWIE